MDGGYDEESELYQTNNIMNFTTCFKEISNIELPSANVIPNDNRNTSDTDELSDNALIEADKLFI